LRKLANAKRKEKVKEHEERKSQCKNAGTANWIASTRPDRALYSWISDGVCVDLAVFQEAATTWQVLIVFTYIPPLLELATEF
jgi:hypothetical protein